MKRTISIITMFALMLSLVIGLSACKKHDSEAQMDAIKEATSGAEAPEGNTYGYDGDDLNEAACYIYMGEVVSKDYEKADASIPIVQIVNVDESGDEILVYGDFWINNYNINGDVLECVSGGNYPGVMHISKDGHRVMSFDQVADGEDFEESAKEMFGDCYEDFMAVYSDSDAREELRKEIISTYVAKNGLEVTAYQDYGWDPVELD